MKLLLASLFIITSLNHLVAQDCKCDVTISKEGGYDGQRLNYKPGQTICIAAGNYSFLSFKNVVGTAAKPIKIVNCGGLVTIGSSSGQFGLQFWDSKFVKVTGTGNSRYPYGIKVNKTPANTSGIIVTGFSSDFEIEKVEVSGTGFAGIMIKNDPTCDPATWRANFAMYNIKLHDNYIHDTGAEGMYIGNSFWNSGMTRTCDGSNKIVFPHNIFGLTIYNNLIERTGAEGIQYACAPESRVYNNVVKNAGISPFEAFQNNGIQASGGVSGRLYNNVVQNVGGTGIIFIGHSGTNLIYNNLVTNTGSMGIFCDNRANTPANNVIILTSNTIINCGFEGFRLYNKLDRITLTNNVVIQAGTGKLLLTMPGVQVSQSANYYGASLNTALKNKVVSGTYKPLPGSPLVDKGLLNSFWGINTDLDGKSRLAGTTIDIGAYELQPTSSARSGTELEEFGEGIEEKVNEITSFPSPCINEVFFRLTDQEATIAEVTIYTTDGKPVMNLTPAIPTNEIRAETATLPTGVYVFTVVTPDAKVLRGRFIKQ